MDTYMTPERVALREEYEREGKEIFKKYEDRDSQEDIKANNQELKEAHSRYMKKLKELDKISDTKSHPWFKEF